MALLLLLVCLSLVDKQLSTKAETILPASSMDSLIVARSSHSEAGQLGAIHFGFGRLALWSVPVAEVNAEWTVVNANYRIEGGNQVTFWTSATQQISGNTHPQNAPAHAANLTGWSIPSGRMTPSTAVGTRLIVNFNLMYQGRPKWVRHWGMSGTQIMRAGDRFDLYMVVTRTSGANPYSYSYSFTHQGRAGSWNPTGWDATSWGNNGSVNMVEYGAMNLRYEAPQFTAHPDITFHIGAAVNWTSNITVRWGANTVGSLYPAQAGTIQDVSLVGGTDSELSTNGTTFNRVGRRQHTYRARDSHSLNTTDPLFAGDSTFAERSRWITVWSPTPPQMLITYDANAKAPNGSSIAGRAYDVSAALLPCGGESGWTNQILDIAVNPSNIAGTFDTILQVPSFADVRAANGIALRNYRVQSSAQGTIASGFLVERGSTAPYRTLSATIARTMRIDLNAPAANASYTASTLTFRDTSSDTLSGLSPTRQPQVLIAPASSSTTPPSNATAHNFVGGAGGTLNLNTLNLTYGSYDVWIRATDRAGNIGTSSKLQVITTGTLPRPRAEVRYQDSVAPELTFEEKVLYNASATGLHTYGDGEDGWTNERLQGRIYLSAPTVGNRGVQLHATHHGNTGTPHTSGQITGITSFAHQLNMRTEDANGHFTGWVTDFTTSATISDMIRIPIKQDLTLPIPSATYDVSNRTFQDTSNDALSGLSAARPTKIAFTPSNPANMTAPTEAIFAENPFVISILGNPNNQTFALDDMTTPLISGVYDVWIWATDRAGNIQTRKLPETLFIASSAVAPDIVKDSQDATLHAANCSNSENILHVAGCQATCQAPAVQTTLEEESAYTYTFTIRNENVNKTVIGTLNDTMPAGVLITDATYDLQGNTGASITLTYHNDNDNPDTPSTLSMEYEIPGKANEGDQAVEVKVTISVVAPLYDTSEGASNILRNQATYTWKEKDLSDAYQTRQTNYVLHEMRQKPGVPTTFTKVSAEALTTGLAGAEFALYKWEGENVPTQEARKHIVDISLLTDNHNNQLNGDWVRVGYAGEVADTINVMFVSAATGEVDLGRLPEGIYTLIETKAPSGYDLPVGQWILTIDPAKSNAIEGDYQIEFVGKSHTIMPPAAIRDIGDSTPTYRIINARPFSIGMSGLGGTTGLLLVGFAIMMIAGNTYLTLHRKRNT